MDNTQPNRQLYIILGVVALVIIAVVVGMLTGIIPIGPGAASAQHQTYNNCDLVARGNCDGADLSGIFMSGAPIRSFSCVGCNFANSIHNGTNWAGSDFRNTNWENANMASINISGVDFTGATNLTQDQINSTGACGRAILPDGLVCP